VQRFRPLLLFLPLLHFQFAVAALLLTIAAPPLPVAVFGAALPRVLVALLAAVAVALLLAAVSLPLVAIVVALLLAAIVVALLVVAVAAPLVVVVVAAVITPLFVVASALCAAFAAQFAAGAELGFVDGVAPDRWRRCSHNHFPVALFIVRAAVVVGAPLALLRDDVALFD